MMSSSRKWDYLGQLRKKIKIFFTGYIKGKFISVIPKVNSIILRLEESY